MGHVRVAEEEVVVSDRGRGVRDRGAVDGAVLAEGVSIANHQIGRFPFVFKILSELTDGSKWIEFVFFAIVVWPSMIT